MYLVDGETGLVINWKRDDDPVTGRWTTLDPAGFTAGDANLFRYVENDPTNATDPTGLVYKSKDKDYLVARGAITLNMSEDKTARRHWTFTVSSRDPRVYQTINRAPAWLVIDLRQHLNRIEPDIFALYSESADSGEFQFPIRYVEIAERGNEKDEETAKKALVEYATLSHASPVPEVAKYWVPASKMDGLKDFPTAGVVYGLPTKERGVCTLIWTLTPTDGLVLYTWVPSDRGPGPNVPVVAPSEEFTKGPTDWGDNSPAPVSDPGVYPGISARIVARAVRSFAPPSGTPGSPHWVPIPPPPGNPGPPYWVPVTPGVPPPHWVPAPPPPGQPGPLWVLVQPPTANVRPTSVPAPPQQPNSGGGREFS